MRILVIGSGGREHALVWKLQQYGHTLFTAPGNGGTAVLSEHVALRVDGSAELAAFARDRRIDLVVPGPELPLTLGVADAMREAGIACFGPDAYCARLEGSKSFAKDIMREAGVPTAKSAVFTELSAAKEYVRGRGAPVVIKADGLAAGKGVVIAYTHEEALAALDEMMERKIYGPAGGMVLIEEFLRGEEVSFLCLCDGKEALPLPSAQDHKAVFDGDAGPNTGGMGAYSPAPILPDKDLEDMADLVARPVLRVLAERNRPFTGVLYAGLMMTESGPKVLEYNVRFGDPECQPQLMRFACDPAEIMAACARGGLAGARLSCRPETALSVVLCAEGYPGNYPTGMEIQGLEAAEEEPLVTVFHSGTTRRGEKLISSGGRVLCVTALGDGLAKAQQRAYEAMAKIRMPKSFYRRDIGNKGLKYIQHV